jgi:secretion/DNA translocation related TadE-like protein
VLALGLITVILGLAGVGASVVTVIATRHQADAAADLAALAAAAHALEGESAACDAARHITRAQHVMLVSCRLESLDAVVEVALRPPGRVGQWGVAHGKARAGRR